MNTTTNVTAVEQRVRAHPAVEEVWDERRYDSGLWAYLKKNHCNGEGAACYPGGCVHVVHEDSFTKLEQGLRRVRACTCGSCDL